MCKYFIENIKISGSESAKICGLYGFLLKMYGFLYGWVQRSFGHPV
jgi:hypothetical protein